MIPHKGRERQLVQEGSVFATPSSITAPRRAWTNADITLPPNSLSRILPRGRRSVYSPHLTRR
jgi:hypothetical protein